MFIDDGKVVDEMNESDEIIKYFNNLHEKDYKIYFENCSKWKYFPYNFYLIKYWLENEDLTLDELQNEFKEYDLGLIIKVIIKTFQIVTELSNSLDIINKVNLNQEMNDLKNKIIRKPFKIESIYCEL